MTPTPVRRRGEQAHADGTFLRKVTMVCFATLVLSGLIVYWIGRTATPQSGEHRPPAAHPPQSHVDEIRDANRAVPPHEGGVGCGR